MPAPALADCCYSDTTTIQFLIRSGRMSFYFILRRALLRKRFLRYALRFTLLVLRFLRGYRFAAFSTLFHTLRALFLPRAHLRAKFILRRICGTTTFSVRRLLVHCSGHYASTLTVILVNILFLLVGRCLRTVLPHAPTHTPY